MSTFATVPRLKPRTLQWGMLIVLLWAAIGAQVATDGAFTTGASGQAVQWIRSPGVVRRLVLGFDSLAADVYWIRAVQYYGSTKLSTSGRKDYSLLYPLLDITTTLDPLFNIAYRFGAILLSEEYPNGPGQPDEAVALLKKGIAASPDRWEYFRDAGFVYYMWRQDTKTAAEWFLKGSKVPGAPNWLAPLAASVLAEGGERSAARLLWQQLADSGEQEWIRRTAIQRLQLLDAVAGMEQLQPVVNHFYDDMGRFPADWIELARAGRVKGVPLDPTGVPYALDPVSGAVGLSPDSPLYPLRYVATRLGPSR
jgi:hypothetical protein